MGRGGSGKDVENSQTLILHLKETEDICMLNRLRSSASSSAPTPHLSAVFSKIMRIGAHIPIWRRRSAQIRDPTATKALLYIHNYRKFRGKHLHSERKALPFRREKGYLGLWSRFPPPPPACLFIFDLQRQDFKEEWHHWLGKKKYCVSCFSASFNYLVPLCHTPTRHENCDAEGAA